MNTDPIADMLIRLKNGSVVKRAAVVMPYSSVKNSILEALLKAGYVKSVAKRPKKVGAALEVGLIYHEGRPRISGVTRLSKPSRRVYLGVKDIRTGRRGRGILVLSTPKGILVDKEAVKEMVGGEALFKIW